MESALHMKSALAAAALALCAVASSALAHGPEKPRHGGVVASSNDLTFELVPQGGQTALYVVDHGTPRDAAGFAGKLTVLKGSRKDEAELRPAGGNRLQAAILVGQGAKVVATVTTPEKRTLTVRFAVK